MRLLDVEPYGISALEIFQAARENLRKSIPDRYADAVAPLHALTSAAEEAAATPYRFDPSPHRSPWPHHRPQRWDKALRRGWAGCADAAALLLAVSVARGGKPVLILRHVDSCVHAQVSSFGALWDPYAEYGCGPGAERIEIPWES